MRTLAFFKNEKNGSQLAVNIEANAIMYAFVDGTHTYCEIEETSFSEETIVSILSVVDKNKEQDKFDLVIGGTKVFTKYYNRDGEIRYSVGNHSYTSMKLLP